MVSRASICNEYDKAIRDFTEAIRLGTRTPRFSTRAASRGLSGTKYDKAIADFTEAIQIDPLRTAAYSSRGLAWAEKRQYDKAIADHNEAIRLEPRTANAYTCRGNAWSEQQGCTTRRSPITTRPSGSIRQNANTHTSRGHAWSRKHEYDKAIADFTEAIRLEPGSPAAYNAPRLDLDRVPR